MYCKYLVNSRTYFVLQELFHCYNKDKCRDKIKEQSYHSLKQVHLHEISFFLYLSFLEELIKTKQYQKPIWQKNIMLDSYSNMDIPR